MDAPKHLDLAPCGAPDGHWAEAEAGVTETVAFVRKSDADALAADLRRIYDQQLKLGEHGAIFSLVVAKSALERYEDDA